MNINARMHNSEIMFSFHAEIHIIGVNPFVFVPEVILFQLFQEAGKDKGPIPIHGQINGKTYTQTLVKYSGVWRLYINTSMLKNSPKRIGETIHLTLAYDPQTREIDIHPLLAAALEENQEAGFVFAKLSPSRRLEITRYISRLKSEESRIKNIDRAIQFLLGKERFVGRDKP